MCKVAEEIYLPCFSLLSETLNIGKKIYNTHPSEREIKLSIAYKLRKHIYKMFRNVSKNDIECVHLMCTINSFRTKHMHANNALSITFMRRGFYRLIFCILY